MNRDASSSIFSIITNPLQWTGGIYCVRYRKGGNVTVITRIPAGKLNTEELREEISLFLLSGRGNSNPNIDSVEVKRIPLNSGKVLCGIVGCISTAFYHAYVILKVKGHYVSLEKHSDSLTIQISEEIDDVLGKFRGHYRLGVPKLIVEDRGNITVMRLKDFIVDSKLAHEAYNLLKGNHCKKFAKDIFDEVALRNKYNWKEEEIREIRKLQYYIAVPAAAIIAKPIARAVAGAANS